MYQTAKKVLKLITNQGFKAYIVGGYPRDLYLKRQSIDIDICTNATPKDLKEIFKNSILSKQEYGGVTVVINNTHFEITTFRKEIKYKNNRFPIEIEYIDYLIDDLERRDFTINTLCIDENDNLIDLLNSKEDIDKKVIKTVGDSDKKIKEDALRILRAIRFATVLDFNLDEKLKQSILKYGYLIKDLSYFRKKEELNKIFTSLNVKKGIELIKELNLATYLELENIDNLILTISPIAIWAQLNVTHKYDFSNIEKDTIIRINELLDKDILDNEILYRNGLYICSLVAEIKQMDKKKIIDRYNKLPIKNKSEILLKGDEICKLLSKKPGPFLKNIIDDLEFKIITKQLKNERNIFSLNYKYDIIYMLEIRRNYDICKYIRTYQKINGCFNSLVSFILYIKKFT